MCSEPSNYLQQPLKTSEVCMDSKKHLIKSEKKNGY